MRAAVHDSDVFVVKTHHPPPSLRGARSRQVERVFAETDADGDGLDTEEFVSLMATHFGAKGLQARSSSSSCFRSRVLRFVSRLL